MQGLLYKSGDFEGPLDLLLQLISRNKLDICDVSISQLVDQYIEQIRIMQLNDMDLASEFLEMASRLIYIKTVSLLPKHDEVDQLKEELTAELMEYDRCKRLALILSGISGGFDTFIKEEELIEYDKTYENIHEPDLLVKYYHDALGRGQRKLPPPVTVFKHIVSKKIVSVSSKIIFVLRTLAKGGKKKMSTIFHTAESRSELVATFLALLELCKANRVEILDQGEDTQISVIRGNKNECK